eukprot:246641-Prymnesium_polylepis.1
MAGMPSARARDARPARLSPRLAGLSLLGSTLRRAPAPPAPPLAGGTPLPPSPSPPSSRVPEGVPPPGSERWTRYDALHGAALSLGRQFAELLTREADLGSYAEGVELRTASGELLLQGKQQYAQAAMRSVGVRVSCR